MTALTGLFLAISGNGQSPPETHTPPSVTLPTEATPSGQLQTATKIPDSLFVLTAKIDDPDGFTYVRSKASASSAIVAKVVDGERFSTHIQSGNWWQVLTRDGKTGYMHVSRIKLITGKGTD